MTTPQSQSIIMDPSSSGYLAAAAASASAKHLEAQRDSKQPEREAAQLDRTGAQERLQTLESCRGPINAELVLLTKELQQSAPGRFEDAILNPACDEVSLAISEAQRRAVLNFKERKYQHLVNVLIPAQHRSVLECDVTVAKVEADISELAALLSIRQLTDALGPIVKTQGAIHITGSATERLIDAAVRDGLRYAQARDRLADYERQMAENERKLINAGMVTGNRMSRGL